MMLLPLLFLHKEAPDPGNSSSVTQVPYASADTEFPLEKWVHVGCEVFYYHPTSLTIILNKVDYIEGLLPHFQLFSLTLCS